MNLIKQVAVILGCLSFGELVVYISNVKIPSSIIGMISLWALLHFRILKVKQIADISSFLLKNMGIFFVPPCIEIMSYFGLIKQSFIPIIMATIVSTLLVALTTAISHQYLRNRK